MRQRINLAVGAFLPFGALFLLIGAGGCKDKYAGVETPTSPPASAQAEIQAGAANRRPGGGGTGAYMQGSGAAQPGAQPGPPGPPR